jgi:hypothetical protein
MERQDWNDCALYPPALMVEKLDEATGAVWKRYILSRSHLLVHASLNKNQPANHALDTGDVDAERLKWRALV